MALENRLELRMLQKLILTPQLQQAIKLLQMPQLELSQTISNELIENPFLEEIVEEPPEEEASSEENYVEPDDAEVPLEKIMEVDGSTAEKLLGFTVDEYFESRSLDGRDLGYFSPEQDSTPFYEQYVNQGTDLYDHLHWQLRFSDAPSDVKAAAECVIGNIDENGYLQSTAEDIATFAESSVDVARRAIRVVQDFDPSGVGARDLKECLLLQLEPLKLRGTIIESLIANNLGDIEKRRYQQLSSHYGLTVDDIKNAVKVIEGLEPKPGRGFSSTQPIYVTPDVYIVRGDDEFRIILNDDSVPRVRINGYYRKLLSQKDLLKKEEKDYLEEKLRSAMWLLKSLDHRNKTLYRVAQSILNFQMDFFMNGVSQLKPLNLKDVATDLGMHESTISRATSNKYLSCGHGIFGFKFFFSSSIRSDDGSGAVSSTSVKDTIKKIVGEEDQCKPLSDRKIADILKSLNVNVARRTIAKYRDELNIPSQNQRKSHD